MASQDIINISDSESDTEKFGSNNKNADRKVFGVDGSNIEGHNRLDIARNIDNKENQDYINPPIASNSDVPRVTINMGHEQDKTDTSEVDRPKPFLALLDRAAMEKERLARIARKAGGMRPKRKREPDESDIDVVQVDDTMIEDTVDSDEFELSKRSKMETANNMKFPLGVVKKTAVAGYDRKGDDITIDEILEADHLRMAMLSAFQIDYNWILEKVDPSRTKLSFVIHNPSDRQDPNIYKKLPFRVCVPRNSGGCMHSKLQILVFDKFVRVCIPSANLEAYDWGETGIIENIVYVQDFERKARSDQIVESEFADQLICFMRHQGVFDDIIELLKNGVVWRNTENVRFVHSIAGSYTLSTNPTFTGLFSLATSVRSLIGINNKINGRIRMDYLASSVGSLTSTYLTNLYKAASGEVSTAGYRAPSISFPAIVNRFRLYFPSHETIVLSKGGKDTAGVICFQESYWSKPGFPREIMFDAQSARNGCQMHSKMLLVRIDNPINNIAGYAYVGSANISESAWGKLNANVNEPKIHVRNWECGVLLPVSTPVVNTRYTSSDSTKWTVDDVFRKSSIPVPFKVSENLRYKSTTVPWFFKQMIQRFQL
ncbi:tyrosyl-DNA phosphodiesterase-domain-containing protein [Dipodascopsis uninucleata]